MRGLRILMCAALIAPVTLLAPTQAAPKADATLRPGQAAFWNGSERREYTIDVKARAWRLRVAYTTPDVGAVSAQLITPGGEVVDSLGGWMSGEAYALNPAQGRWRLQVSAPAGYTAFRLRAKLEKAPAAAGKSRPLLPNLRLVPPFEFTFVAPVSGGRGVYAPGVDNPVTSCTADDVSEHQAMKCLRFSLGPANAGEGPLQLVFPPMEGVAVPGKATQVITWSNGRTTTRAAGEFEYHKTHAHYHHSGFGSLELLKVTDAATGRMEAAGKGPKQGFCTADVVIADWTWFGGVQGSAGMDCVSSAGLAYSPAEGTKMGLTPGWADIYSWAQDGNYVEFGLNTDGRYVVRSTADALNHVQESNEGDNTSYAYLEITGTKVKVLERGRGQGPWDPRKVVVKDGLHPLADTQAFL
jgi:hypothetical protein